MRYLKIQIAGHLPVTAFPSQEKTTGKHPDFVGPGVSVWVNDSKPKQAQPAHAAQAAQAAPQAVTPRRHEPAATQQTELEFAGSMPRRIP